MAELTLESKIKELIKEHSKELKTQEEISSFSTTMMKNLLETALGAEINEHLGYEKHSSEGYGSGNMPLFLLHLLGERVVGIKT